MVKVILVLAAVGGLGWLGYQELELGGGSRPVAPSVGYPTVDAGDGVGGVGEGTKGILGGP